MDKKSLLSRAKRDRRALAVATCTSRLMNAGSGERKPDSFGKSTVAMLRLPADFRGLLRLLKVSARDYREGPSRMSPLDVGGTI